MAIDDAKAIIDILTSGTADNAQMLRIALKYKTYAGDAFVAVDPDNPTSEELALNFLVMLRRDGRQVLRGVAEVATRTANNAAVTAAGDAAVSDL